MNSNALCQQLEANLLEFNQGPDGSPDNLIESESGFFLTANHPFYGKELWFSDGSAANTRLVKDIWEGQEGAGIRTLAVLGDQLFFNAHSNNYEESEIWVSDGTEEGTYKFMDSYAMEMKEFNGRLFFSKFDQTYGLELWVSDGTQEGTQLLKDINIGSENSSPRNFYIFNDELYFIAGEKNFGADLYKTDGTTEGTQIVKVINPNYPAIHEENRFLEYNGEFYFFAKDEEHDYELWKSDGTESGTIMVKDINPEGSSNTFLNGAVADDGIYFEAFGGSEGSALWKSDGTSEGTVIIKDVNPDIYSMSSSFGNNEFTYWNNEVYFVARDDVHGFELWKTDGTEEGTSMVRDLHPGSEGSDIRHLTKVNDQLIFTARPTNMGTSYFYTSDGTAAGTKRLSENAIYSGPMTLNSAFFGFNNDIYFAASSLNHDTELWKTDGTINGTKLFKDFNKSTGSWPNHYFDQDGVLYFTARSTDYTNKLYISNGSKEGTRLVKNLNPEGYTTLDEDGRMTSFKNEVYFSSFDADHGFELWKSDGTSEGTKLIRDIYPGSQSSIRNIFYFNPFFPTSEYLYFLAEDGIHGEELWVTDGSTDGTSLVKDILPGQGNSGADFVTELNDEIYFKAWDGASPALWKTNGSANGTQKIYELEDFNKLTKVNNKLILFGNYSNESAPFDLLSSDGTAAGTIHLKKFGGLLDSEARYMDILNDELYFRAITPDDYRRTIYKTDGTLEGTAEIFDSNSAGTNMNINYVTTCGDYIYFLVGENIYRSTQLWRTAGTKESTLQLISEGDEVIHTMNTITCLDNTLYFSDDYPKNEIWQSSGTPSTTRKISYLVDGKVPDEDFRVIRLTTSGNVLYIEAETTEHGLELYSVKMGELATLPDPGEEPSFSTDFKIDITNETCAGKGNGMIKIESSETAQFVIDLNEETYYFNSEYIIDQLSAGTYSMCISLENEEDFEQCFEFEVESGGEIEGRWHTEETSKGISVAVKMEEGTAPYYARLNGQLLGTFDSKNFTVIADRTGDLEIHSSKSCEGILRMNISPGHQIIAFPNPADDFINIVVPETKNSNIIVDVFSNSGQLISSENHKISGRSIKLDLRHYKPGIYYSVLRLEVPHTIKFVKK